MPSMETKLAAGVLVCLSAALSSATGEFSNTWVVELRGGPEVARRVARDLGYHYHAEADPAFPNHFIFKRADHPDVSKRSSVHLTKSLTDVEEVDWAEQQEIVTRSKRGVIMEDGGAEISPRAFSSSFFNSPFNPPAFSSQPFGGGRFKFGRPSGTMFSGPSSFTFKPISTSGSNQFSPFLLNKPGSSSSFSFPSFGGSSKPTFSSFVIGNDDDDEDTAAESQADTSKLGSYSTKPCTGTLSSYNGVTKHIGCASTKRSAYEKMFNDPLWTKQWYAQDYRTSNMPVMDLNLVPVYKMGITGKRVVVAVVDDGVQHGHPDLMDNFLAQFSYDMNNDRKGSNPEPDSSHGTKCAGEIAMVANNRKCGVGVAYNSKIIGVKILGARAYDYMEARGLVHRVDIVDIYSNSWGPNDDGMTLGKIGRMSDKAIEKGVTEGRNGKGSIYVFAGGNGRHNDDNCAMDGMVNHKYTIGIASVSQFGKTVYYSERCTAIFAGSYSSGNGYDEKVATIDLDGGCTTSFSGTSAAAPLATGIIALTLEANPDLTYRDVMHLITMSAEVAPVADNADIWYKNGAGFWVSNDFGFGILNAENMVTQAKSWKTVPELNTCIITVNLDPTYITVGEEAKIMFETEACQDTDTDAVYYLESIQVASTITYPYRGAISISITSPAGTKSKLLEPRPKDDDSDGLQEWNIKSVHNWGENPKGSWEVEVTANSLSGVEAASGYVEGFIFTFYGTKEKPAHYDNLPRKYSDFRLSNGQTSEV